MKYPALASTFAVAVWILGAGAAAACIPPLTRSAAEQAEADLSTQASAWAGATSVYIGRIAEIRAVDATTGNILPGPQISSSHEIVLIAEQLLKGPFPHGAKTLTFTVSPWCVPSDIERGRVGDRFVVYVGAEGASARSGMIALDRIRHPDTLAAAIRIAQSMKGDTEMSTVNGTGGDADAAVADARPYETPQNPPAPTAQTHEAQPNRSAPTPEKIALLERYFEAARLTAISDNMVDSMVAGAPMHRYSVSEQTALRSAVAEAVKSTSPWLLSRFAEIYSRAFTIEEIEALVEFYESPVGRSLTAKTAGLTDEAARIMPEYQALVLQRFEAIFCGNGDCGRLTRAPATEIPVTLVPGG